MGKFGGFYKGEKKKKKKDLEKSISNPSVFSPTITMPEIISKKKKDY
ncbi:MAG: hypothetical protein HYT08_04380 [Candidatus Levybacteria bacterium]|nr:hypothetical protein [Candidatus Levybacteria bacterium]